MRRGVVTQVDPAKLSHELLSEGGEPASPRPTTGDSVLSCAPGPAVYADYPPSLCARSTPAQRQQPTCAHRFHVCGSFTHPPRERAEHLETVAPHRLPG